MSRNSKSTLAEPQAAQRSPGGAPFIAAAPSPERERPGFDVVYEQHFEFVWRSLRALGVGKEALDDAAQDVFGAVARQLPSFEGRSSIRTWVFGIVQNVAANHRRWWARKGRRCEPLLPDELDRVDGLVPTPQAHAEQKEAAGFVIRFCLSLEEPRRAVFVLALLEGVPAAEIAALLGVPINTVYSRVYALRRELAARMNEWCGTPEATGPEAPHAAPARRAPTRTVSGEELVRSAPGRPGAKP